MDTWLKGLIAVACVATIATGGYLVWSERQQRHDQTEASKRAVESTATRQQCRDRMKAIENGQLSGDDLLILQDCIVAGAITNADFEKVNEARRKRMGG